MALLKKTLVAAVACGAIAFAASAFAQAGGAGTNSGSMAGTTLNNGVPATGTNTQANNSGTANIPGTSGPAGSTSAAAAQAINPGGAPITGTGTSATSPAAGTALGGNGIPQPKVAVTQHVTHHVVQHVARNNKVNTAHHITHVRLTTRHVISPGSAEAMSGQIGVGSTAAIQGLGLGNTATPVAGLSARRMATVNSHERHITSQLNRAELHGTTG